MIPVTLKPPLVVSTFLELLNHRDTESFAFAYNDVAVLAAFFIIVSLLKMYIAPVEFVT